MARFGGGWVKAYRNIYLREKQANPFYGDGYLRDIWVCLLVWANYKPTKMRMGRNDIVVEIGQVVTSVKELCLTTGFTPQVVRTRLDYLKLTNRVTIQSTSRGSIITICNYEKYQKNEDEDNKPNNTELTNDQQTTNKRLTNDQQHIEEYKNSSNQESEERKNTNCSANALPAKQVRKARVVNLSAHDLDLGQRWADYTKSEWPFLKADPEKFAQAIADVRRKVGLDDRQLDYVFEFVKADEFWKPNCQSPAGLLKASRNGVRKIDNILAKIKSKLEPEMRSLQWALQKDAEMERERREREAQ